MNILIALLLLPLGIAVGLNLPDLDHKVGFLVHRSIVTHGFLLPLLVFWAARTQEKLMIRFLSIGLSLSMVAHLCFDLFPKAWIGFALISIPLYGRTSPLFSWLWIAGSIVFCLYLALLFIKNLWDTIVVVASSVVSFGFCAVSEAVFWPALIAIILATFITLMLPSNSAEVVRSLVRKSAKEFKVING